MNWWHRFWNPHCEHCQEERRCLTCDVLKIELERANYDNRKLLEQIERIVNPQPILSDQTEELPEPIRPRQVPWGIEKNILEAESRIKARILREKAEESKQFKDQTKDRKTIEDLEKDTGISDEEGNERQEA